MPRFASRSRQALVRVFPRGSRRVNLAPLCAGLPLVFSCVASRAATHDAPADVALPTVEVVAPTSVAASPIDPNMPASTESVTRDTFENWNVVNTEDVLKYLPGLAVRKRFVGDLNSIIAVRGTSNSQSARGVVYADGLLLSNFLGNSFSFPPRWSLVFPEEIARADVIYGPFSALYPGNSIGATVELTTRMPDHFEADADVQGFTQHFDLFGINRNFSGAQTSATVGDRIGKLSFFVGANHLENTSQPLQFATLAQSTTPARPGDIPVTGAQFYHDQNNKPTAVFGVNGEGIERTIQDELKLKLRYAFTPTLDGDFTLGYWHQTYNSQTSTFLRDANGNPVYSGSLNIDGYHYTLPASALAPSLGQNENWLYGLSLRTHNASGWNAQAIASYYDVSQSIARLANSGAPGNGPGTFTDGGGTGWKTLDLKASYTPDTHRPGLGLDAHVVTFGYHYDNYFVDNETYNTLNWQDGGATSFANAFKGKTQTQAVYAQDAWEFVPRWHAVYGVRYEWWRAYDGARALGATSVPYASASEQHASPKASLSFDATNDLTLRASYGRAYRFPTVGELFQGQINGSSIVNNNPNLKPENDQSKELTAEWSHWNGLFRLSLFEDDVRNALFSQTDTTVIPNVTSFQNIGRVRSRGVELGYSGEDVAIRGLDLIANVAYTQSKILENAQNPASVGKYFYRIPLWRVNVEAAYRVNEMVTASAGLRYSGRQYNTLTNTDTNPDVFGGTSNYTVADLKVMFHPNKHSEVSVGVDNLFDERYFVYHPYPGRTFFVEAKVGI